MNEAWANDQGVTDSAMLAYPGGAGDSAVDELTEYVNAKHAAVRDSELAYVCRCGAEFTRGGGDGSDGERAYLEHIGYGAVCGGLSARMWGRWMASAQTANGCNLVADLFPASRQALCWYGRHRAQIRNMELNAHPDAEVRRLTAIVESNALDRAAYQNAIDTINAITTYIRDTFPEELNGRPVDKIVTNLLMRLKAYSDRGWRQD